MKKFFALLMALVMLISVVPFAMAADAADHEHYDNNKNDVCDAPGCTEPVHTNHYDKNGNGVCDHAGCTEKVVAEHTHVDANHNGVCDYPGCTEKMPVDPIGPGADDEDQPGNGSSITGHTHSYYSTYKRNSTKHWRECWCGQVKAGSIETHNFYRGKCRTCGYTKYGYDYDYDYDYGYGDYRVYVTDSGKGDTDVSTRYADSGDIVYIYVDPDNGYKVRDIEVTYKNGRELNIAKRSSSTYYFRMPSSNVYVDVTYAKGNSYDYNFPYGGYDYDNDYYYGNYTDVSKNDWFYSAVNYVTNHELVSGQSYNKFAPNANFTRATLAQALYNLSGANASGRESFSDVDSYDWFYDAVVWCSNKNIVKGYNGKFDPDGDITREDLAVMLYRYAEYKRYNLKASEDLDQFSDADKVSAYAVEAVEWAVAEGLLNGMGDGTLNPQGTTTRAQAAAMLMRFCKGVA